MLKTGRDVVVAGIGLHPFGRFPDKTIVDMSEEVAIEAIKDAGINFKDIEVAYFANVLKEVGTPGEYTLARLGLTGIPILNVENACASGSSGIWQAWLMIATGVYDVALVIGAERVPRGPVVPGAKYSPQALMGTSHQMAEYALRMRRYMHEYGAPAEAIAQASVKAHKNAVLNPYAQFKKVFSLEEVMNSRMIADPVTLYQCCPTSEGAAAAVVMSKEAADRLMPDSKRAIRLPAASLHTSMHRSPTAKNPKESTLAAREVYEISGIGPEDVDIVQVHDAATIGEIQHLEQIGVFKEGEAWQATMAGDTEITGRLPVNTDGGLQAMGHPFGASGIRMVHELVTQLRGEAGERQVNDPSIGLAQCAGAGGVSTVIMLAKD